MRVVLDEAAFVRIPRGDPTWLVGLGWSTTCRDAMDEFCRRRLRAVSLHAQIERHRCEFTSAEWDGLHAWLARASRTDHVSAPRLLDRRPAVRSLFMSVAALNRQLAREQSGLERRLAAEADVATDRALALLDSPDIRVLLAHGSSDLVLGMKAWSKSRRLRGKDRRNLARAICGHLARSMYKSAPLGLSAGTAGLRLDAGKNDTLVTLDPDVFVAMRPNQELCNRLIATCHPLDEYLARGGPLHVSVTARLDGDRVLWWRTHHDGDVVRESLGALRLTPELRTALSSPRAAGLVTQRRLAELGVLVRGDLVTPADSDPWSKADAGCERSTGYKQARRLLGRFVSPRPVDCADQIETAVEVARELAHDHGLASERTFSSALSVDSYRLVEGGISDRHRLQVIKAIRQYLLIGGLAYSRTPSCRNRGHLVTHFRRQYGDGQPVRLHDVLVRDWETIDGVLSFLLSPTNPPVHPENDLVFPEPTGIPDAYTAFFAQLRAAADSAASHVALDPVTVVADVLHRAQPTVDVVCRLGRSGRDVDVVVESATMWGRLTGRHERPVAELTGGQLSACMPPVRPGHTRVTVLVSPAQPRLQNLSRLDWTGDPLLAVSDPVPPEATGSVIRYTDLYVRYEPDAQEFVITTGSHGPPLEFHWPSPLSPAFNRRLHFLRYLTLTGSPVVAAPRWLPYEGTIGGHLPRVTLGPLVLCPERWSVPLVEFAEVLDAGAAPRAYLAVRYTQQRFGIPDEIFVYSAADTRPAFVDLTAPWGADTLRHLLRKARRQQASVMLFEEVVPRPADGIVTGTASNSFVLRCHVDPQEPPC